MSNESDLLLYFGYNCVLLFDHQDREAWKEVELQALFTQGADTCSHQGGGGGGGGPDPAGAWDPENRGAGQETHQQDTVSETRYEIFCVMFDTQEQYRRRSHEPTNQSKWSIYIMRAGGTDSSVRVTVDDIWRKNIGDLRPIAYRVKINPEYWVTIDRKP